jgi:hypothetical protein
MILIEIINEFFHSLSGLGSLHWSFVNWEVFSKYFKKSLAHQIQHWKNNYIKISLCIPNYLEKNNRMRQQIDQLELTEEEVFLNFFKRGRENLEMLKDVFNSIMEEFDDLSCYTIDITERKMYSIDIFPKEQAYKKVKRISKQMAGRLESFNKNIKSEIPSLQIHFSTAIDSYSKAASFLADFDAEIEQDILDSLDIVNEIKELSADTREDIGAFRETMASCSCIEDSYDRAKINCLKVLDNLDQELESAINFTQEIENLMDNLFG